MGRFDGKVALVTGSARGIGQGIALCLAEGGADVIVNDLPPDADADVHDAQDTARQIEAMGRRSLVQYADVAQRDQVEAMFTAGVAQFGHIDIVVANAAMTIREPVIEAKWEHVQRVIDVCQFGVFHTCQFAAQQMVRQNAQVRTGGKIVVISSILSEIPLQTSAAYNMAKAGIIQFARTLAAEVAPYHINVNVIAPGWIDTPGEHKLATEDERREGARRIPWGRLGLPRDIGNAAAFLASDEADYITGTVIKVDGGYLLGLRDD